MSTTERIHPDTSLGPVELVVGDLDAMASFYERAIGLVPASR
jgi:catechol-2,3-dioxygenase